MQMAHMGGPSVYMPSAQMWGGPGAMSSGASADASSGLAGPAGERARPRSPAPLASGTAQPIAATARVLRLVPCCAGRGRAQMMTRRGNEK